MEWLLTILCLGAVLFLGDDNRLLPVLVCLPIGFSFIRALRRKEELFSPSIFFTAFYLLWMGAGFAVSFFQRNQGNHPNFAQLAFLILLAYFAWLIGLRFPRLRFSTPSPITEKTDASPSSYDRAMKICLAFLIAGLAFTAYFYLGGALKTLLSGRIEESRISMFYGRGYLYFLAKSINTVVPIYIGLKWYGRKEFNFFDCLLLLAAVFLIAFPLSRRPVMWFLIILIILYYYLKNRFSYRRALFLGGIFLIAAVAIHQIRSPGMGFINRFFLEIRVHVENIVLYLRNLDLIGNQGLRPFLMNISMLMPGHQIDFGLWLKETLGLTFAGGGISVTLIGEGFLAGGRGGVVVEAFLIGVLLKITYRKMKESFTLRHLLIYIIILYKATEAINYGLALQLISGIYEIGLVLLIVPPKLIPGAKPS